MDTQLDSLKDFYTKRAMLIINPVSGQRAVIKFIPQIIRKFMDSGYLVSTFITAKRSDATCFTRDFGKDYDLICCAGGDGTLNEVVTGLILADKQIPVGYIPCGSTNDFATSHNLSLDPVTAAHNIVTNPCQSHDVGKFGDSYFTYVAAFGAFSWISYSTDQNLKNALGHTAYIFEGIRNFYKIKPIHLKLTANGTVYEDDYIFGVVCNSTSVAGLITLPQELVDTNDGMLEVMLIKMPKSVFDLDMIIRSVLTNDYSCPLIDFFHTDSLEIDNSEELEWSLDGERNVAYNKVKVSVLPSFLKLKS